MSSGQGLNALIIRRETPDQPDVQRLLDASDALAASLYPAESNHMVDVATLVQPNVIFLVARASDVGETIVGCGAAVLHTEHPNDAYAEIKRMFVEEHARGGRVGSQILHALEAEVRAADVTVTRLETGVISQAAIALYERASYKRIGPFGDYWDDPLSLFYEKSLDIES